MQNSRIQKFVFVGYFLFAISYMLSGCATVPPTPSVSLPTYNINGTTYISLVSYCNANNINWEYDTFTRRAILKDNQHTVNLWVGDDLVLVDGLSQRLSHPVDLYQGAIVIPYNFKQSVLDGFFQKSYPAQRTTAAVIKIKKIVIDAGHGGNDPGAIGKKGTREKDVNLDIARRVANLLKSRGVEVIMTRSTDRFVPLYRRAQIANDAKANLFISIHSNANRVRSLKGFEVYYVTPTVNDTSRAYTAAKESALKLANASFASNSLDLKATLWDMIYASSRAESIALSHSICQAMNSNLNCPILGVKGARFQVLRTAQMPAILIEVGFLSNPTEESKLKNSFYRQKVAEGIVRGIEDYSYEARFTEVSAR